MGRRRATARAPHQHRRGQLERTVTVPVGGLKPNTRYHFRAIAQRAGVTARRRRRSRPSAADPSRHAVDDAPDLAALTITGKVSGRARSRSCSMLGFLFSNGLQAATAIGAAAASPSRCRRCSRSRACA
jgi:hypothetical protein